MLFEPVQVLINVTATQAAPAQNINFCGIGFRESAYTYMDPHGLPSGGDWALARTGAVYLQVPPPPPLCFILCSRRSAVAAVSLNGPSFHGRN